MPKKNNDPVTVCDDCGLRTKQSELAKPLLEVEHLNQRITPGCQVPAGECECGALAYVRQPPLRVTVEVQDGVAEVTKGHPGVKVTIKDHDNH